MLVLVQGMQQRQRYYFVIPAVTDIGRLIGLLITAQFVAFVLLTHSIILGAVIAPIAVLGIYLMFRRPTADFFAEIGPSALTIRMVFNYRISYWSIESVGLFRNESGGLMDLANRMADK